MARVLAYAYLVIILGVLAIPSTVPATEMSSKRDCAICHVMWLNDFRTDKQTLIEWQPANVLMKDTQGVVSSEEICYSCHDGYVNDSRSVVWKYNRHKTFVKPSNNVTIPADLPLSSRGEIYCGTCHSAHGVGAAPDSDRPGLTSFFREKNVDSSLCQRCHTNEADYRRSNGHPLKATALGLPETLLALGSVPAKDKNKIICQTCHRVHGAKGDKIVIVDNQNSTLCTACHGFQKELIGSKHDLRLSMPDEKNIKQQEASASGPCGACHMPHNAGGLRLWARRLEPGDPASGMCLTCHGEKAGYQIKGIGDASHPVNVFQASKTAAPRKLPLFAAGLKKTPAGRIQCLTCHEVHRWAPDSGTGSGDKNTEGDASNSFLRISNSVSSALCLECHTDKKQLITSDHNLNVTAADEKNVQGFTPSASGACGACHVPHNAAGLRLWAKRLSGDKDVVTQLCTGCHHKGGAAEAKLIGDNYHPVDVAFHGSSLNGAGEGISTLLPFYDSAGNRKLDGKDERMVCITCHEPHTWSPQKTTPMLDYTFKNIEGDTTTSFLRKANFPSSDLCKACHPDKALVDGTDHDLNVTAPSSINILGQRPAESGVCGVCHLVHNSKSRFKLWAQEYGKGKSRTEAMCRSCHREKGYAQRKIPRIASHPEGKLINNANRNIKGVPGYFPLFHKITGEAITAGDFSCPSCHNAHQWSPFFKKKGVNNNLEGTVMDSFLRNSSYYIICIDCHGPDALFRYQYFHDPDKRAAIATKK